MCAGISGATACALAIAVRLACEAVVLGEVLRWAEEVEAVRRSAVVGMGLTFQKGQTGAVRDGWYVVCSKHIAAAWSVREAHGC